MQQDWKLTLKRKRRKSSFKKWNHLIAKKNRVFKYEIRKHVQGQLKSCQEQWLWSNGKGSAQIRSIKDKSKAKENGRSIQFLIKFHSNQNRYLHRREPRTEIEKW